MLLITILNLTTSSDQTCLSIIHINQAIKVIVATNHNSQSYNFLQSNLLKSIIYTTSSDQNCLPIVYTNKAIKVIVATNHDSQSYNFFWSNLLVHNTYK